MLTRFTSNSNKEYWNACKEVEWIRNSLVDVPLWTKTIPIVMIYYDNETTFQVETSKTYNNKSRHIS
jgi:hypothetical protein